MKPLDRAAAVKQVKILLEESRRRLTKAEES